MKLKVITIDFWNTIFDNSRGSERNAHRQKALINGIDKFGIVVKQDEFSEALSKSWEYFNTIWKGEQRTPAPRETVEFLWNYLKLPFDETVITEVVKEFGDSVLVIPPNPMEAVKESLEFLSAEYSLGLISDTGFSPGTVLRDLLKMNDIYHNFSEFSFSDETGVSKPHPKAFGKILNTLNCKPSEALHVGDIEATDIAGAKAMGMKAIRFAGDPTAAHTLGNSDSTIADYTADNWHIVVEIINSIN